MSHGIAGARARAVGVLFVVVITLIVFYHPLIQGSIRGHDSRTHISWLLSVLDAVRAGNFYPRWLPDQFAGLGAPVLYYYPPFSSLFFALIDQITLHRLPVASLIVVATFLLSLASSATFYFWARGFSKGVIPLAVAVFYGVAPYHFQIDYMARGAMAEFAAFVWIPLIFAGIQRWMRWEGRGALALVILGCAGLFLTHLLSGMLVAMAAVPYVFLLSFEARPAEPNLALAALVRRKWLPLLVAVLLSVAISACYLVPALTLLPFMNQSALMTSGIDQTSLHHVLDPDKPKSFAMIAGIALLYLLVALACMMFYWRRRSATMSGPVSADVSRGRLELLFWGSVITFFFVFMMGWLNILVKSPSPLGKIQFLWRALVVVEFAVCTLICLADVLLLERGGRSRARTWGKSGAVAFVCIFALASAWATKKLYADPRSEDPSSSEHVRLRMSPPEYFPPGAQAPVPTAEIGHYPSVVSGSAEIVSFKAEKYPSRFELGVRAEGPATIALPSYGFPGWTINDETGHSYPVTTATPYKLLAVDVGQGMHVFSFKRVALMQERIGNWVSLVALLATLVFLVGLRSMSRTVLPFKPIGANQ